MNHARIRVVEDRRGRRGVARSLLFYLPNLYHHVSADLAVRGLAGDRDVLPRGARFPQGHPVQLPRGDGPSHQQEQPASG